MSTNPKVTALGITKHNCQVVTSAGMLGVIECGAPASVRLEWEGLHPLYLCCECYELEMENCPEDGLPSLEELRGQ
jgi:hypothetical protein